MAKDFTPNSKKPFEIPDDHNLPRFGTEDEWKAAEYHRQRGRRWLVAAIVVVGVLAVTLMVVLAANAAGVDVRLPVRGL